MRRRPIVDPEPYESGIWGTPERPCPSERTLAAHLDGELTVWRRRAIARHLDECPPCAHGFEFAIAPRQAAKALVAAGGDLRKARDFGLRSLELAPDSLDVRLLLA